MNKDGKRNEMDEEITVAELRKSFKSKNYTRMIPHLHSEDGKVKMESKDTKQVKWFEGFKK